MLNVNMLSVVMLKVVILNVVMLGAVAHLKDTWRKTLFIVGPYFQPYADG
jgi:hypothetical protein